MKWIVTLPDGAEYPTTGANPEEAAQFVSIHCAQPNAPGQTLTLGVRRDAKAAKDTLNIGVVLHSECRWTACPRRYG